MAHASTSPVGRCLVCGEPLAKEPYWITQHPDGEHRRCRDWASQPWPFEDDLIRLRRRYGQLKRLLTEVEHLGRWLVATRRLWPTGAKEIAREGYAWLAAVEARIERLRRRG